MTDASQPSPTPARRFKEGDSVVYTGILRVTSVNASRTIPNRDHVVVTFEGCNVFDRPNLLDNMLAHAPVAPPEPAEPVVMAKFAVGDRVQCHTGDGSLGKITQIDMVNVLWDDVYQSYPHEVRTLTLLPPEPPAKPTPKFRVGEWVVDRHNMNWQIKVVVGPDDYYHGQLGIVYASSEEFVDAHSSVEADLMSLADFARSKGVTP